MILRKRIFDDNAFVFEATRYKGFNDGMPWNAPETIKELEDNYYKSMTDWIAGSNYTFNRAGVISIRKSEIEDIWNIGYWTHPQKQNKGYMTEAVEEVINFGFSRLHAASIEAQYALWNIQSETVLINNGMKKIQYVEKGFMKNDKWVAENKMEITKEE